MELPTLNFKNSSKKKKILLLSDDLRLHSGIATMSREIVLSTCHKYDWVQLGAAIQNPDQGKVLDLSQDIEQRKGIKGVNVKVIPWSGYGDPQVLRDLLRAEKPDAIMHFTDPRFWGWLYEMEDEIRKQCPIIYYAIWDDTPVPHWNANAYESCDLIMGISKQSHNLHNLTLADRDVKVIDLDKDSDTSLLTEDVSKVLTAYVPHGIDDNVFKPLEDGDEEYKRFKQNFYKQNPTAKFVIFWNNRNIRRKQPGDLMHAYKLFCDMLSKEERDEVLLLLHTQARDENGTDLIAVKEALCPDLKVAFSLQKIDTPVLNMMYNLADVTVNIASNEGFGISAIESLMAGTPIINNVTGGLQDHCRFEDEKGNWVDFDETFTSNHLGTYRNHGNWVRPVFPSNRSLQGSIATPYIFDDRCDVRDVANELHHWYSMSREQRRAKGELGRQWVRSEEAGMTSKHMGERMIKHITTLLDNWKPRTKSFTAVKVGEKKRFKHIGITY